MTNTTNGMTTMDEVTALFSKTEEIKAELMAAREALMAKVRRIDGMIAALTAPSDLPTGPVKTLDDLVMRTVRLSNKPLKSTEIAKIVSAIRPTKPYVISSILSRLKDRGMVKVQGQRGSYLFSEATSH